MKRMLYFLPVSLVILAIRSCGHTSEPDIPPPPENSITMPMLLSLPINVNQTASLSPSANDTVCEPTPALSNDNPVERLQAVRKAQDKWGKDKVAPDIDRSAILGLWNFEYSDAVYRIFFPYGVLTNYDGFVLTEGTYRFLSHHEIELTLPGLLYGNNVMKLEYRLLGDTLEFKVLGFWITYKRPALVPPTLPPGKHKEKA